MHHAASPQTLSQHSLPLNGLPVLVVDDNLECCNLIALVLQLYGATTQVARDAETAFQYFLQFRPRVMIIDLAMPIVNGFALLQRIRSLRIQEQHPVPAIALTARVTELMRQDAIEAGFNEWMAKPIDIDSLIEMIARLAA